MEHECLYWFKKGALYPLVGWCLDLCLLSAQSFSRDSVYVTRVVPRARVVISCVMLQVGAPSPSYTQGDMVLRKSSMWC